MQRKGLLLVALAVLLATSALPTSFAYVQRTPYSSCGWSSGTVYLSATITAQNSVTCYGNEWYFNGVSFSFGAYSFGVGSQNINPTITLGSAEVDYSLPSCGVALCYLFFWYSGTVPPSVSIGSTVIPSSGYIGTTPANGQVYWNQNSGYLEAAETGAAAFNVYLASSPSPPPPPPPPPPSGSSTTTSSTTTFSQTTLIITNSNGSTTTIVGTPGSSSGTFVSTETINGTVTTITTTTQINPSGRPFNGNTLSFAVGSVVLIFVFIASFGYYARTHPAQSKKLWLGDTKSPSLKLGSGKHKKRRLRL